MYREKGECWVDFALEDSRWLCNRAHWMGRLQFDRNDTENTKYTLHLKHNI